MRRSSTWLLAGWALGAAACATVEHAHGLNDLDGQLLQLRTSTATDADASRAKIAANALSTAQAMRPAKPEEQLDQVGWYRLAAVASVEAHGLGAKTLGPSSDGGGSACDALPSKDASAPRDCTLVRIAFPIGVVQDLDGKAATLTAKRDTVRAAGQKLGPDDLATVNRLFDGYQSELTRVGRIAAGLPPGLDTRFTQSVDDDQRAIYCRLPTMIRTALAVDGQNQDTVQPLSNRKDAARQQLEPRLGAIDCLNPGGAVALPQ
jgi:hypothetical protein